MNPNRNNKGQFDGPQLSAEQKAARRRQLKKAWEKENVERRREYSRARRKKNPNEGAETRKRWAVNNREKVRAYMRKYKRKYNGLPEPTRPEPAVCECCGQAPNGKGRLHLDHCHRTGVFRGWLCFMCNSGIGKLGDDLHGLVRAIEYLARSA